MTTFESITHPVGPPFNLPPLDLGPLDQHVFTELELQEGARHALLVLPRGGQTDPAVVMEAKRTVTLSPVSGNGVILVGYRRYNQTRVKPFYINATDEDLPQGITLRTGTPYAIVNTDEAANLVVHRELGPRSTAEALGKSRNKPLHARLASYAIRPFIGDKLPTE